MENKQCNTWESKLDAWCDANGYEATCTTIDCGNVEMACRHALTLLLSGKEIERGHCIQVHKKQ